MGTSLDLLRASFRSSRLRLSTGGLHQVVEGPTALLRFACPCDVRGQVGAGVGSELPGGRGVVMSPSGFPTRREQSAVRPSGNNGRCRVAILFHGLRKFFPIRVKWHSSRSQSPLDRQTPSIRSMRTLPAQMAQELLQCSPTSHCDLLRPG